MALSPQLAAANQDLQAGKADAAIATLREALQGNPRSAPARNLLCRADYALGLWNEAADQCEQAVRVAEPNDPWLARYHLWLGRALGERADRASFLTAYSLGKRVREEFEAAVSLDPRDAEAMADLGEFYYSAPGVVGGGVDKAEAVARKLEAVDAARGHELWARIADQKKDTATAEREFQTAIRVSAHPAFQWMSLASFYRRHERLDEAVSAVKSGLAAEEKDKRSAVALFNGASVLTKADREPRLAAQMLAEYLASAQKTEEAPAFVALVRLARLQWQLGDQAGAKQNRQAALALAREYKPAQGSLEAKPYEAKP